MFFLAEQTRRRAAMLLLFFFVAAFVVLPTARAKADAIPVWDIFNTPKEWGLDAIAFIAAKAIIKAFRTVILRAMITGRFGGLSFSTSFTIDVRKYVENEARQFMSEFTGLNFCNGRIKVPPESLFAVRFELRSQCSVNNLDKLLSGEEFDPVSYQMSYNDEEADYFLDALAEKEAREALARTSFIEDFRASSGFLGKRDATTGKIKTPGEVVGDYLQENVSSVFREGDVADEMLESIVAIVNTAVSIIIEKGLDEISS